MPQICIREMPDAVNALLPLKCLLIVLQLIYQCANAKFQLEIDSWNNV